MQTRPKLLRVLSRNEHRLPATRSCQQQALASFDGAAEEREEKGSEKKRKEKKKRKRVCSSWKLEVATFDYSESKIILAKQGPSEPLIELQNTHLHKHLRPIELELEPLLVFLRQAAGLKAWAWASQPELEQASSLSPCSLALIRIGFFGRCKRAKPLIIAVQWSAYNLFA